jgi:hypothetical protein
MLQRMVTAARRVCYVPDMRQILATILLLIAAPAMAQSTLILPEPGGAYLIVPPVGPSTQVLPQLGGGALVVTGPGGRNMQICTFSRMPFSGAEPCCPGLPQHEVHSGP